MTAEGKNFDINDQKARAQAGYDRIKEQLTELSNDPALLEDQAKLERAHLLLSAGEHFIHKLVYGNKD